MLKVDLQHHPHATSDTDSSQLLRLAPTTAEVLPAPIASHETFGSDDYMLLCKGAPDFCSSDARTSNDPAGGPALPLDDRNIARLTAVQEPGQPRASGSFFSPRRSFPLRASRRSTRWTIRHSATLRQPRGEPRPDGRCLVGLVDPPRADIPDTVRTMRGAVSGSLWSLATLP